MKFVQTLLIWVLLLSSGICYAQQTETDSTTEFVHPLWPKCKNKEQSHKKLRAWFAKEYVKQLELYYKQNKEIYEQQQDNFTDCKVHMLITETGKMELIKTTPQELCSVQQLILQNTINEAPTWIPGTKNGKAISVKYTMPMKHSAAFHIKPPQPTYSQPDHMRFPSRSHTQQPGRGHRIQ